MRPPLTICPIANWAYALRLKRFLERKNPLPAPWGIVSRLPSRYARNPSHSVLESICLSSPMLANSGVGLSRLVRDSQLLGLQPERLPAMAAEASVDPASGERHDEIQRYVRFGWAHTIESPCALAGEATDRPPLSELLSRSNRDQPASRE